MSFSTVPCPVIGDKNRFHHTYSQLGGSSNVVRIYIALAWRNERFHLARGFEFAVQEGKLNTKVSGNLGRRRT